MNFHVGQMYVYLGNIKLAKQQFQMSLAKTEPNDSPIKWNAYVSATLAFLEQDRGKLELCRDKIAAGPRPWGI